VFASLPRLQGRQWIAIGRLDFNTSGVLLFTDSGVLANRLTHPSSNLEREYAVRVMGELTREQAKALKEGIVLEDGPAHFDDVKYQGGEGANRWYNVTLREGRNREVRRMFETLGLIVSRLIRTRFGPVTLPPRLARGRWQMLDAAELERLLAALES
jgi:23S rRNA pseudouridine2605 synthase